MLPTDWRELFNEGRQPLIGMVHLRALPGAPGFNQKVGMRAVLDAALADVDVLKFAGFDALLFVNEADVPYESTATPAGLAAMSAIVTQAAPQDIPFGVEFLFDSRASLACAIATGASFIRGGIIGVWDGVSGVRQGGAAKLMRERAALGASHIGIFSVAQAELAFAISSVSIRERLAVARHERAMDVVLLASTAQGVAVDQAVIDEVRSAVGPMPIIANSGVKSLTVSKVLTGFDGCLVGSDLKREGQLSEPVDRERATAFITAARDTVCTAPSPSTQ